MGKRPIDMDILARVAEEVDMEGLFQIIVKFNDRGIKPSTAQIAKEAGLEWEDARHALHYIARTFIISHSDWRYESYPEIHAWKKRVNHPNSIHRSQSDAAND